MFRHQKSRPALFACPYCVSNTPANPIPKPLTPTSKRIVGLTVLSCNAAQHNAEQQSFFFLPSAAVESRPGTVLVEVHTADPSALGSVVANSNDLLGVALVLVRFVGRAASGRC
jgi:hypothetical protein